MLFKQLFNSENFPTIVITNIPQNIFCVSPMTRESTWCQNSNFWLNPLTYNSEHSSKNIIYDINIFISQKYTKYEVIFSTLVHQCPTNN